MKCTCAGIYGCICAMTDALVEPTSVTIAPGFRLPAISLATLSGCADRHRDDDQVGIPSPPLRRNVV
jgi:hypothetical protein